MREKCASDGVFQHATNYPSHPQSLAFLLIHNHLLSCSSTITCFLAHPQSLAFLLIHNHLLSCSSTITCFLAHPQSLAFLLIHNHLLSCSSTITCFLAQDSLVQWHCCIMVSSFNIALAVLNFQRGV